MLFWIWKDGLILAYSDWGIEMALVYNEAVGLCGQPDIITEARESYILSPDEYQ